MSTFIIKIYDLRTYDCVDEMKVYNLNSMIYLKNVKFLQAHMMVILECLIYIVEIVFIEY